MTIHKGQGRKVIVSHKKPRAAQLRGEGLDFFFKTNNHSFCKPGIMKGTSDNQEKKKEKSLQGAGEKKKICEDLCVVGNNSSPLSKRNRNE